MRNERETTYIYGKHAVKEALEHAPRFVKKVFLSSEAQKDPELRALVRKANVTAMDLRASEAEKLVGVGAVHQGMVALVNPDALLQDFKDFIGNLNATEDTALVLLHELSDPHNVGAIIRSAAAFGAAGVLIPPHRQSPITGAVVKASAGMAFRVPLVAIGNMNYTIETLKEAGFKIYSLAMEGERDVSKEKFDAPSAFIIGNEGEGIRAKTLEHSDAVLRIPMHSRTESLNASVSAAIVLYQWSVAHKKITK